MTKPLPEQLRRPRSCLPLVTASTAALLLERQLLAAAVSWSVSLEKEWREQLRELVLSTDLKREEIKL